MANLKLEEKWIDGIYQLEVTDPVMGGEDGIDNLQAKQLGGNIFYLRKMGIAAWDANFIYSKFSLVNVDGVLYASIIDGNKNKKVSDTTAWKKVIVDVIDASTTQKGVVKLNDTTSSTSTIEAATANAVKVTMDKANSAAAAAGNAQTTANTANTNANGRVPNTRKVNNKALSADITLTASDVSALPLSGGTVTGNTNFTGKLQQNGSDVITAATITNYTPNSVVLYPNGTEANPGTITKNQIVKIVNPFNTMNVMLLVEALDSDNTSWGDITNSFVSSGTVAATGIGVVASCFSNKTIQIMAANGGALAPKSMNCHPLSYSSTQESIKYRIRVIKLAA